jgi:hypothetical protein
LQEWLFSCFLKVIHSIYGVNFNGNEFFKSSGGSSVLTLEKLPQRINDWFELETEKPRAMRRQRLREIQPHLVRALCFLTNNFTALTHASVSPTGIDHVVHEKSQIALESNLEILLVVLLKAMDSASKTIYFRERRNWGSSPQVVCVSTHRLKNDLCWCPGEPSVMRLAFGNDSFYFASRVIRKPAEARHSQCTSNKCLAFHLEAFSYQTAHTTACEGCNDLLINSAELLNILESNDESVYPRVKIIITDRDEVKLSNPDQGHYVAISHVWSDRVGQPPGVNSLPECQLRRFRFLVQEIGLEEPIVWIGSLCVLAETGPAKRNALSRIADAYRNARKVLFID